MKLLFISFFILLSFVKGAFSKEKTVFITGGAGFIGSNFLNYMFDHYPDYKFIVLDLLTYASKETSIENTIRNSDRFEFIQGNITDQELMNSIMKKSDYVVHFAAESDVTKSIEDDLPFVESNIEGTRVLLRSLLKHKNIERFIHISSSEVYGTAEAEPMEETHSLNPRSPYAATKLGAEKLVYSYCCTYDIPAVIIRAFNNYGPNQHIEKMLPRFIISAIKHKPLKIEGTGDQKRDWIYTYDVAAALDKILHCSEFETIKHQTINLGTGIAISVIDIAQKILDEFKLPSTYLTFIQDRPGQVDTHISSTEKAKKLLDWTAETTFDQGLKETIAWYLKNQNKWDHPEFLEFIDN